MNPSSIRPFFFSLLFCVVSLGLFAQQDPENVNATSLFVSDGPGVGLYIANDGDSSVALSIQGALINRGGSIYQEDSAIILIMDGLDDFEGSLQNLTDSAFLQLAGGVEIHRDIVNEGRLMHSGRVLLIGDSNQNLYGNFVDSNALWEIELNKNLVGEAVFLKDDVDVGSRIIYSGPSCIVTDSTILYLRNPDTNALVGYLNPGDYTTISRTIVTLGNMGGLKREVLKGNAYDFPVSNPSYYNPVMVMPLDGPDTSDVIIRLEPYAGASVNFNHTYDSLPCLAGPSELVYNCMLQNGTWRIDGRDDGQLVYQIYTYPHSNNFGDCILGTGLNFRTLRSPVPGGDWTAYVDSIESNQDMCIYYNAQSILDLEGIAIPGGIYSKFSSIGVGAGPPSGFGLPVEWLFFEATAQGNNAILNWATGVEVNNAGFEIYRSEDAIAFEQVGFVGPSANPQNYTEYHFTDTDLQYGQEYYYQIKQIDQDGSFDLSEIERLFIEKGMEAVEMIAYPNPTSNQVILEILQGWESIGMVECYNALGLRVKPNTQQNSKQVQVDLSQLENGQYHFIIRDNEGKVLASKSILKL